MSAELQARCRAVVGHLAESLSDGSISADEESQYHLSSESSVRGTS